MSQHTPSALTSRANQEMQEMLQELVDSHVSTSDVFTSIVKDRHKLVGDTILYILKYILVLLNNYFYHFH